MAIDGGATSNYLVARAMVAGVAPPLLDFATCRVYTCENRRHREAKIANRLNRGIRLYRRRSSFAGEGRHPAEEDGLMDGLVPINRRCGHPSTVVGRLTGETRL